MLSIVGVVNIPIIYFSVKWWNTLHQGASVKLTGSSMETTMLTGMLVMSFAFWFYSIAVVLARVRADHPRARARRRMGRRASRGPRRRRSLAMNHWNFILGAYGLTLVVFVAEMHRGPRASARRPPHRRHVVGAGRRPPRRISAAGGAR